MYSVDNEPIVCKRRINMHADIFALRLNAQHGKVLILFDFLHQPENNTQTLSASFIFFQNQNLS